ncbi:unnamed protein product [Boreogadus saida]
MDEKIIVAVSAMPVIFNTTLKTYKDRTVKAKAWEKVSEEVGLTEEECRRRWKVLRDTYLRVRRRQEAGKRSGSAAGPLRTWKYSAILSFLCPFVTPRETSSNMVLGVEEDGIAEYPVEDQGSEAAAGTASDLGDLSCEVLEAAAASEPIPPPPTAAAVTTPPIAPVMSQYQSRKREMEIEKLLVLHSKEENSTAPQTSLQWTSTHLCWAQP